ncbi:S10 family peptidase [Acidomonas methanolica]|uniref:S10 family peptidase n=1 Tax=Acidomonas methanolica TaxID=437 RepID=UPI00211A7E94|nr:peptidase S10 [Acidomonas methanolica]
MTRFLLCATVACLAAPLTPLHAESASHAPAAHSPIPDSITTGSVALPGGTVAYKAIAGTILVHAPHYDDSSGVIASRKAQPPESDKHEGEDKDDAVASMFYVAYFKQGVPAGKRPVTFLYNGGPGSATVWLHMGSVGPLRLDTPGDTHLPAPPYTLIANPQSLLDVTDLVFIDAPGTGFSRITGHDADKAFYGVDADGHAFTDFIVQFLAKYDRFNSPRYLFGESYGTTRSAVVANDLEDRSIDLNGVILLSQILNYDNSVDEPEANPGIDDPYILALPTYAATAWYHKRLSPMPADLPAFLREVEHFALTDYSAALRQGADLPDDQRKAIAAKLAAYTGLPAPYILRSGLRVNGGQFTKELLADAGMTTGRLDTRFSGPTLDPISREAGYDPQSTALSSAYVSAFNVYVRQTLHYGEGVTYKEGIEVNWDFKHHRPGPDSDNPGTNVMPDLARVMKEDPKLRIMLNSGYYDLATPYFEGVYEMKHLPIPASLYGNIEFKQYASGHMVYVKPDALQRLHDNVADFIRRTDNL